MPFKDLDDLIEPLKLPMRGKTYTIPPLGFLDGAKLEEHLADKDTNPMSDEDYAKLMLGPAYDEMVADNVPEAYIARASLTAFADRQRGRATAEVIWETGGDPKAIQAWYEKLTEPAPKTRPAAARTTRRPATGSGTKTSRKS